MSDEMSEPAAAPDAGLLERLIALLNAVADAYDIEYDGEEGRHDQAVRDAGIALDDFAMEHGRAAAHALSTAHSSGVREGMEKAARMCGSFIRPEGNHTREYATACADLMDAILAASKEMRG